ncbi:MAG TPA: MEDS domain-containing protein [Acidobacteriaceae bacterium]|nr:MEDS domain-containing protein [Acidobacteriaceae bacterium]
MALIEDAPSLPHTIELRADAPIRLAGSTLDHRAHVCAFFNNADEAYQVLLPFIKQGFELAQKSVHTIDPRRRADHRRRLRTAGIELDSAMRNEQLEVVDWSSTHLSEGAFDPDRTLSRYRRIMEDAAKKGFPLTRFVTDMGWALEAELDANALLDYEARTNYEWMQQRGPVNPVICTYDLNLFTADIIVDVMRTHPMVIIGGTLRENPFFVPPGEFLEQLRRREPTRLRRVG